MIQMPLLACNAFNSVIEYFRKFDLPRLWKSLEFLTSDIACDFGNPPVGQA
ncbi:hypothetical protein RGAI101_4196 [Roseobacter sp. GAI101]|nr:hypothetical protein RGAI101_4196 [Roseobacter sp. GAI101]